MKEIFDIFSKKKLHKKNNEKKEITADYREKNSLVISELVSMGLAVKQKDLPVGDYIVGNIVIERKTISDFISSMINKRLVKQLESLSQIENKLLIVEGIDEQELYSDDFSEKKIGIHPNSIRGFLLSILLKYKIPIIFTKNYEDTAKFIFLISKKKENTQSLHLKRKNLNKKEQLQFILESFPGIGPKTSKKLLKKFKSIKGFVNANQNELKEVLGKKTEAIIRMINQKY